ncbi:cytochrome P450 [Exophiala viscosa]|uniref:cytochrome P450 n=1 Tax=Exophiala viscosa TaxID=2486360 RepID=UPI0021A1C101|nr:cytochrome P450 [Exophiala viscosa]
MLGLFVVAVGFFFFFALLSRTWDLRHIPGPLGARLTNFWLFGKYWKGEVFSDIALDLQRKYGPVVRYGPRRVLFSDLSAVGVIFNTKNSFVKAESYGVIDQIVNGKLVSSFATTRDEARVSSMKKQLNSAFTTAAMLDYEPHVDHNINFLISKLQSSDSEVVDMARWTIFFAFDTICRIAFSDDQGFMEKQSDLGDTLEGARGRFAYWHWWGPVYKLERLLFKNRFATRASKTSLLGKLATERLQARLEKGGLGTHSDLLDRYLQAGQRDPTTFTTSTIIGVVISTIHAGAETTSATLNVTLYRLLQNPRVLAKLRAELDAADLSSPPSWQQVSKLPYLEACFKEAARMHPIILDPTEREVPAAGAEIAGVWVPGGTVVAVNHHALNRDPSVWGDDVSVYRPERWMEADDTQRQKMQRADLLFSAGKRSCLGQHVAWIEMKKFLPELLNKFDIELVDPKRPITCKIPMVFFVDDLPVRLAPRKNE